MTAAAVTSLWRRVLGAPAATFLVAFAAVVVFALPGASQALELDRALGLTQPWRALTAHAAHFTLGHLAYDLLAVIALGWTCEVRWPMRTRLALAAAPFACTFAFVVGAPHLATYRGLSGLATALFALLAVRLHMERRGLATWMRAAPALALVGLALKLAYEFLLGVSLFVGGGDAFVPVPAAHLAGVAVGAICALARARLPAERPA